jgi:hypothetical protein
MDLQEKIDDNLINFKSFLTKKLFSNLKLLKDKSYIMKCIYCDNKNIIMSSKYVLQRCNKCNKEYIPKIKK